MGFISRIREEIKVIRERDPAIHSDMEVFLYPSFKVMIYYRIAHKLYLKHHYFLARWVSQKGVRRTGIEIHPGAQIGKRFFIDHGNGVIIGETTVIGDNVTLYQGVTLGAAGHRPFDSNNFDGEQFPRHPVLEDNVTVYSNSTLLGRITIGHDTIIGGNIWVTHDVPPNSRLRQSKFVDSQFEGGLGI